MNQKCKELYLADMGRYGEEMRGGGIRGAFKRDYLKSFHYYLRKSQTGKNRVIKLYYRVRYVLCCKKHHIEIPSSTKIGKGLYLGHPYCITINAGAVIGNNCNIHKGVTIGQENRGVRKGTPTIGNKVWIGINAVIVGKITIGDDVLVAPNAYVNCNVPSHSIVLGNPCIIKHRDNATEGYINNIGES